MVGATETTCSLSLIDKAKKRLVDQRAFVERLGFYGEPRSAVSVRDIRAAMRAEPDVLEPRRADQLGRS